MGYFQERDVPVTVLLAQVWDRRPGATAIYRRNFRGYAWPEIEFVAAVGDVPSYGIVHRDEGDVVIQHGDYVTLDPASGDFAASSWYAFVGNYEEVPNAPT